MSPDDLAASWLGYALAWAARRRRRWGDAVDWEQVAIDGLWLAARGFRATEAHPGPSKRYIDKCLSGAATSPLRTAARRRRMDLRRVPMPAGEIGGWTPEPWVLAAMDEETKGG